MMVSPEHEATNTLNYTIVHKTLAFVENLILFSNTGHYMITDNVTACAFIKCKEKYKQ